MCTSRVSNVIYHKFSHGAAFYTLNGKNVNVMLEYGINPQPRRYVKANGYDFPLFAAILCNWTLSLY